MKWTIILLLLLSVMILTDAKKIIDIKKLQSSKIDLSEITPIEDKFPLQWKLKIGAGSFKTNYSIVKDKLIMGSNGMYFMDYYLFDKKSGVYSINPVTGKVIHHFGNEVPGDMDVNGVLVYNKNIYFGNDNEEIICTDLEGKQIWRKPMSGDIEHEPVLINTGTQNVIIFATELGEVQAVSPKNGKAIWKYYAPEFKGWKPGENRAIFKVAAYAGLWGSELFYKKPFLADLNDDKVNDLIYVTYWNKLIILDGKNGNQLLYDQSIHPYSFLDILGVKKEDNETIIQLVSGIYKDDLLIFEDLSLKGTKKIIDKVVFDTTNLVSEAHIVSENILRMSNGSAYLTCSDRLYRFDQKEGSALMLEKLNETIKNPIPHWFDYCYRPIIMSNTAFNYNGNDQCIALITSRCDSNMHDILKIVSTKNNQILETVRLPSKGEMGVIIEDVNKDGLIDLLYSGYDGYLYCFKIPS